MFELTLEAIVEDNPDAELFKAILNDSLSEELIEELIKEGINVNARNSEVIGDTALMIVIGRNNDAVVQLLIDKGADVNLADSNGCTPLMHNMSNNNRKISKLLIQAGAKTDVTDTNGDDIWQRAKKLNKDEFITTLEEVLRSVVFEEFGPEEVRAVEDSGGEAYASAEYQASIQQKPKSSIGQWFSRRFFTPKVGVYELGEERSLEDSRSQVDEILHENVGEISQPNSRVHLKNDVDNAQGHNPERQLFGLKRSNQIHHEK